MSFDTRRNIVKDRNFSIRLDKFKFGERLTKFVGCVIGGGTHASDVKKIGAINYLQ